MRAVGRLGTLRLAAILAGAVTALGAFLLASSSPEAAEHQAVVTVGPRGRDTALPVIARPKTIVMPASAVKLKSRTGTVGTTPPPAGVTAPPPPPPPSPLPAGKSTSKYEHAKRDRPG
jgi:hypothetical protein